MSTRRWFLPESPDLLGMLEQQAQITIEGIDELIAWSEGDADAATRLRQCEHRGDDHKQALRVALTDAFTTPLEPEDLFTLSMGIDDVLNSAKDTVREAEVMHASPDGAIKDMAEHLAQGAREVATALRALAGGNSAEATAAADRAIRAQRRLEHVYRRAMSALVDLGDLRELAARRELYRRVSRTSDVIVGVAERIWYAVLKES